jgi:hypothetical protein
MRQARALALQLEPNCDDAPFSHPFLAAFPAYRLSLSGQTTIRCMTPGNFNIQLFPGHVTMRGIQNCAAADRN